MEKGRKWNENRRGSERIRRQVSGKISAAGDPRIEVNCYGQGIRFPFGKGDMLGGGKVDLQYRGNRNVRICFSRYSEYTEGKDRGRANLRIQREKNVCVRGREE